MSKAIKKMYKDYNLKDRGYSITRIDFEDVIYKDYGNFDIEVSGLDNYRMKRVKGIVFIWETSPRFHTVKRMHYNSFEELYNILLWIDSKSLEEIIQTGE